MYVIGSYFLIEYNFSQRVCVRWVVGTTDVGAMRIAVNLAPQYPRGKFHP